ncbi:MAG: glycosyltransferase family 2 protein [Planctomycetota bacterium]|jgi:glycosyltransferase involved in cell wall biosynthesis
MARPLSVTFVIPCLDEEETLPYVLEKINQLQQGALNNRNVELVVSDNGSTDHSISIAQAHNARVIHCRTKGYGAALMAGIEAATGDIVIFADADDSYNFLESPLLIEEIEKGYDLVVGSRFDGKIESGAMPLIHRYVGTPILNWVINGLYARNGNKIRDCNSGFRCFLKHSFLSWNITSDGMEFASEMLVKSLKSNARVSHVPVTLSKDKRSRGPHLQRWRDGMRHLLQIFFESPEFFHFLGITLLCLSWMTLLIGLFRGHFKVGPIEMFGINSMLFGLFGSIAGILIWTIGLYLALSTQTRITIYKKLIHASEDKVFWSSVALGILSMGLLGALVVYWGLHGFVNIYIEKITVAVVALASNIMLMVYSIITTHLLKRGK